MKKYKSLIIILIFLFFTGFLEGCFIVKKFAGADLDPEQFQKARESKIIELRSKYSSLLVQRISNNENIENADITFFIGQELLNKIAHQYDSTSGWLDKETSYIIKSTNITLHYGSAFLSLNLLAHNNNYNVDVNLAMDCLLAFEFQNNEIVMLMEPFNISPVVNAGGLISTVSGVIENLVKINLGNLSKTLPQIKLPINFSNEINLQEVNKDINDKVNFNIKIPNQSVKYNLRLSEILIFEERVFVSLNIENVEVK